MSYESDQSDFDAEIPSEFDLGITYVDGSLPIGDRSKLTERDCVHCERPWELPVSTALKVPADSFFNCCPECLMAFLADDPRMIEAHTELIVKRAA